ncbi:hypothetical protein BDW59DRAFT_156097 [Aspergillus cavernicola]|uniref:FAD-binding domain-containing protein n=1 Tax=Aspergillus cavernicola TaxID=176166 RepID=A0ABR4J5G2_9EURO
MNVELDQIQLPTYPSGSYNFIRRLRNEAVPKSSPSYGECKRDETSNPINNENQLIFPVKLNITIIGAGVGGLSTAIALKREGHSVTVYEQALALSEVGAGIQIPPNSSRILHSWGLKAALERRSIKPTSILWRRWQDGSTIGNARLNPELEEEFGSPYYVTHRAHLHDALHERVRGLGVPVRLGKRVEGYEVDDGVVRFSDREVVKTDLVIAADGIKSFARKLLNGERDKGPYGHGLAVYRATVSMDDIRADPLLKWIADSPALNLWLGHNLHVMSYAIAGGERYNLVLTHPTLPNQIQNISSADILNEMRSSYDGWDPVLKRLLDLVNHALEWPIHAVDIPERWASNSGKLVLIGDSAHAMAPYMALGAAMAVEDAAAMAAALNRLGSRGELGDVISKWTAVRKRRVTQVHQASFGHGLILHLPDGPVQRARDEALKAELGEGAITESPNQWNDPTVREWVYAYRPDVDINESF